MTAAGQPETAQDILGLLADLESRSRETAIGLPQTEVRQEMWQGLSFVVSGVRLVSAMSEVTEMLRYPDHITRVPGASPWMLGVANVRGNLLPVLDLQAYLGGKPVVPGKTTRVLVINQRGVQTGVVVTSVLGMRHFEEQQRVSNTRVEGAIGAYVYDAFNTNGEIWPVFSMLALSVDPGFRSAAA
jgi:twitching motility protein PilI